MNGLLGMKLLGGKKNSSNLVVSKKLMFSGFSLQIAWKMEIFPRLM